MLKLIIKHLYMLNVPAIIEIMNVWTASNPSKIIFKLIGMRSETNATFHIPSGNFPLVTAVVKCVHEYLTNQYNRFTPEHQVNCNCCSSCETLIILIIQNGRVIEIVLAHQIIVVEGHMKRENNTHRFLDIIHSKWMFSLQIQMFTLDVY